MEWKEALMVEYESGVKTMDTYASHQTQLVKLKGGKTRIKFDLPDRDLDEQFTKGFGPGGQKTNKSNNCVILTHLPTGLQSRSHDNRLQQVNRKIARQNLINMLDVYVNQETSKKEIRIERTQRNKERQSRRRELNDQRRKVKDLQEQTRTFEGRQREEQLQSDGEDAWEKSGDERYDEPENLKQEIFLGATQVERPSPAERFVPGSLDAAERFVAGAARDELNEDGIEAESFGTFSEPQIITEQEPVKPQVSLDDQFFYDSDAENVLQNIDMSKKQIGKTHGKRNKKSTQKKNKRNQ